MTLKSIYFKKDGTPYEGPDDFLQWGKDFMDIEGRRVGNDTLPNGLLVPTVWLGLDHNYGDNHRPLIFESMVFFAEGGNLDMWRYSTWKEAELGHKMLVKKYRDFKTADEVVSGNRK